jgi:hypothetical protein
MTGDRSRSSDRAAACSNRSHVSFHVSLMKITRRARCSFAWMAGLALLASFAAGCSGEFDYGPTGTVSGRLTMDGKPLKEGTQVAFMQLEKGYIAFGPTDPDGNFTVSSWNEGQLPVGQYTVMIQPPGGVQTKEPTAEELLAGKGKVAATQFPMKYSQTSTSGLKYEVKEGENRFEIDISSQG